MVSAGELVVSIIGDMANLKRVIREVQTDIKGMSQELTKVGKDMSSAGSAMSTGITAPIVATAAGIGLAANASINFDTELRKTSTMLPGITKEAFNQIGQQSLSLSKQFGEDTKDVNEAWYNALSSNVPQDNVFEFMKTSSKLAIGGMTDVNTAVDGLTSVINAYGAANISAAQASDIMFVDYKKGKVTIEELSKQLADVTPIAAANKVSFADLNSAIAAMTAQGTRVPVAMTQTKSLINELSQDTTQAGAAFKQLAGESFTEFMQKGGTLGGAIQLLNSHVGETIPDLEAMNKAIKGFEDPASEMSQKFNELTGKSFQQFIKGGGSVAEAMKIMGIESGTSLKSVADAFSNIEGKTGALQLVGEGGKLYNDTMAEMQKSTGATDEAFKTMSEGMGHQKDLMIADWKAFVIESGQAFLPVFRDTIVPFVRDTLIPAFQKMVPVIVAIMQAFGSLSPTLQLIVIGLIGLLAAAGPALLILGAMASALGALSGLFAAGGLLASGGAVITALGSAITLLTGPIGLIIAAVALLSIAWARDWGGVQEKAAAVWSFIQDTANTLYNRLEYTYHAMIMSVSTLRNRFSEIWDLISSALSAVLDGIIGLFNLWYSAQQAKYNMIIALAQWLYAQFSGTWNTIKSYISQTLDFIVGLFNTWYSNIQNNFNRVIAAGRSLYTDLAKVWADIEKRFNDAKETIIQYLQELKKDAETEANNIVNKILGPFSNIKQSLEGFFEDVKKAGKALVQNLIDGIEDMLPDLGSTVDKITDKVASYLPMHSPARIGPLSTLPKWDDLFINPLKTSVSKMGGTIEAGLNSIPLISNNHGGAVSNVYEGSNISIGPNAFSNSLDINALIDEINRRATAQRRARGYIL